MASRKPYSGEGKDGCSDWAQKQLGFRANTGHLEILCILSPIFFDQKVSYMLIGARGCSQTLVKPASHPTLILAGTVADPMKCSILKLLVGRAAR